MRVHSLRLGFDADDQRLSVGRPRSRPARQADVAAITAAAAILLIKNGLAISSSIAAEWLCAFLEQSTQMEKLPARPAEDRQHDRTKV
jgi:hypothetical protein